MDKAKPLELAPHHDITAFCDPYEGRYALQSVMYRANRKELVSTDSRVLCLAPVDDGPDKDVLIPKELLATARKLTNRQNRAISVSSDEKTVSLTANGITLTADKPDGKFPDYPAVIPNRDAAEFVIAFNANLLARLAKYAIECVGTGERPVLEFRCSKADEAVVVKARSSETPIHAWFVLMPLEPVDESA